MRLMTSTLLGVLLAFAFRTVTPQLQANEAYKEFWNGNLNSSDGAIAKFRAALSADPAFPYRWADLGDAYLQAGDFRNADICFARASELAPTDPRISTRLLNQHFRRMNTDAALATGEKILRGMKASGDESFRDSVFNTWLRMGIPPEAALSRMPNSNLANDFILFLMAAEDEDESDLPAAWKWLDEHSSVTETTGRKYALWLLFHGQPAAASKVWRKHVSHGTNAGVIGNPGFEVLWSGEGFDWISHDINGIRISRDTSVAHSGRASLRLDADGAANVDYGDFSQNTWLESGRYRLSGFVRTRALTGDSGFGLALTGDRVSASTPLVKGDSDWTEVSTTLTVPEAGLCQVRIIRPRSLRADGAPQGTVWIDDISLERIP